MKPLDISGKVFGSLTALYITDERDVSGSAVWVFQCACGNTHKVSGAAVKRGLRSAKNPDSPSCGCHKVRQARKDGFKHGYAISHPKLYAVYTAMIQRCHNPNSKGYASYGAKGVTVCEKWRIDPKSFFDWAIENGYKEGLHLDKDKKSGTTKTYSPETCQFLEPIENVQLGARRENYLNRPDIKITPTQFIEIQELYREGELTQRDIASMYGISQPTVWKVVNSD